jgi:hypothetical protein
MIINYFRQIYYIDKLFYNCSSSRSLGGIYLSNLHPICNTTLPLFRHPLTMASMPWSKLSSKSKLQLHKQRTIVSSVWHSFTKPIKNLRKIKRTASSLDQSHPYRLVQLLPNRPMAPTNSGLVCSQFVFFQVRVTLSTKDKTLTGNRTRTGSCTWCAIARCYP